MRSASLYRTCGSALMLGAFLWAASALLAPVSPEHTLSALKPLVGGAWVGSAWLGMLGSALALGGALGIYRHFAGSEQEGWAALGLATFALGVVVMAFCHALLAVGQPGLLAEAGNAPAADLESAQVAFTAVLNSAYLLGGAFTWLAMLPLGIAMLRDRAWPRLVAWGAIVMFLVEEVTGAVIQTGPVMRLFMVLACAYLVLVGNTLLRFGRGGVPTPQPEATTAKV